MKPQPKSAWPPIIPFLRFDLPGFPLDALPAWAGAWAEAEAIQTQTPSDLAAMVGLSVGATATAKRFQVVVRPGWSEPTNVFTATTLEPANRKSAVVRDAVRPLEDFQQDEARRLAPEIRRAINLYKIATRRLEAAQKAAATASEEDRLDKEEEAQRLAAELAAIDVLVAPRLIADDATPEKLTTLISEQGGRMAVLSPEGDVFEMMAGRYSSSGTPNLGVYLKGHAGDTIIVDRVGRPPEYIRDPALTIGLAVQLAVLRGLMDRPGFRGRGLLARFLYSVPQSTLGHRLSDPPTMPHDVREAYHTRLLWILHLPAETDDDGNVVPRILRFTPDALACLLGFQAEMEPRLGEHGDLGMMSDWAGKLPGAVVRIAGILHVMHHAGLGLQWHPFIDLATIENAIRIGRYLIPHAMAAFAEMGADPVVEDAKWILRWLDRTGREPFTVRDAFEGLKGRFKKVEAMEAPLVVLVDHNYIRLVAGPEKRGRGRPASPTYEVNPLWPSQYSQYSHNSPTPGISANSANSANDLSQPITLPDPDDDQDQSLEEGVV